MGYRTPDRHKEFLSEVSEFEKMIVGEGIRFLGVAEYPAGNVRRARYTGRRDKMIAATETAHAPWAVVRSNDKRRAGIEVVRHISTKIVIIAPPYSAAFFNPEDDAFVNLFEWRSSDPTQVLVFDKTDLTKVSRIEIDPFWVYHFGNAYDVGLSEIGFDFALHDDPSFMANDAFAAMDGSWDGGASAASHYAQARINLKSKTVRIEKAPEHGQVEFIQTNARENLLRHRHALMLAQPGGASVFGFNRLLLVDRTTGNASSFDVGETEILEEHLIVQKPGSRQDFWIMGTALDWKRGTTNLSIYEGMYLSDGPIMKAEMDLALPLGLHGTFIQSTR